MTKTASAAAPLSAPAPSLFSDPGTLSQRLVDAYLAVRNETVPRLGVYACRVRLPGQGVPSLAVANLGQRPTFGGGEAVLEAHLLDFEGDLYGKEVRVEFAERLRDERRFPGPAALLDQIGTDVATARRILEKP